MKKNKIAALLTSVLLAGVLLFAAACSDPNTGGGSYTLREFQPGSPDTWNPHTWESSTDNYILGYNTMALYDFVLNSKKDGYDIIPEMAAADPVDVTTAYVGQAAYGVPADATEGYAFKIALNPNAKWENGDVINADTYVESMKRLLDPTFVNRRADSFYNGQLVLANAEAYFKQLGETKYSAVASFAEDGKTIIYADVADADMYISVTQDAFFFGASLTTAHDHPAYTEGFTVDGVDLYPEIKAACENSRTGMIKMTDKIKAWLGGVALNFEDNDANAYKQFTFYASNVTEGQTVAWDTVGIKKTGEFEITLILKKQISEFYLFYNLGSSWIVHIPTYDRLTTNISTDYKRTSYNTTKDSTMSYGPYKLSYYLADKQFELNKNDAWYGWTDGKHKGQFQTTNIVCEIIAESTAVNRFLKGDFDNVTLGDEYEQYRNSSFLSYVPESYMASIAVNTNMAKLKSREKAGINKTMLTNKKFRKAISFAVDRVTFNNGINPVAGAGFSLLNDAYIADPDSGATFRSYDAAKEVVVKLNELQYGAGKDYATLDEAYEAVTNYDKTKALQLFTEAFAEETAKGNYKLGDKVSLDYLVYAADGGWELWATLVNDAIAAVLKGTELEGKVEILVKADQDFTNTMRAGGGDLCRAMWGGSDMDPFSVLDLYLKDGLNYSYGFDGDAHEFTLKVDGTDYTMNLNDWFACLNNSEGSLHDFSQKSIDTKVEILAAIEYNILSDFSTIPLYSRQTAQLFSKKIRNATNTYLPLVGFGGIRFMTYTMDDAAWETFKSDSSNMNYK